MPAQKFTDGQLEAALRKHAGIKALAAKHLKVKRATVQERVDRSPRLQALLREIKEDCKDLAEGVIVKALRGNDKQTARWYLERQGKDRDYSTKVETENKLGDGELEAIVVAFGGDLAALRALRAAADPAQAAKS